MAPLRVGIVGNGYATKAFHIPLIRAVDGLDLVALASGNRDKAAADWPGLTILPTPDVLFADPTIDLVIIPTPNDTHHPLAVAALAAGKHVVVDKPFTLTPDEANDLIARAKAANRVLSVFHNRRWDGDFLTVRDVVASGELGRVVHFESHFDRYRPQVQGRWRDLMPVGGGLWYDLGSHLLDQTLTLFGAPEHLSVDRALQRDGAQTDDWFHAILRYGTMRVILHAATLVPAPGPRFIVHGTKGTLVTRGLDPQENQMKVGIGPRSPDWNPVGHPARLTVRDGDAMHERDVPLRLGTYTAFYEGVRDAILTGAPNPVPPEEVAQVMALIERGRSA